MADSYKNVEVISNRFTYDDEQRTDGYELPLAAPGFKHILYYGDRLK